ncbi:MAG TPA: hypothetical protein VF177_20105 [Anaerolineae bacterium]
MLASYISAATIYGIGLSFTAETAGDILQRCEQLVHRMEQHLRETGQLEDVE